MLSKNLNSRLALIYPHKKEDATSP